MTRCPACLQSHGKLVLQSQDKLSLLSNLQTVIGMDIASAGDVVLNLLADKNLLSPRSQGSGAVREGAGCENIVFSANQEVVQHSTPQPREDISTPTW